MKNTKEIRKSIVVLVVICLLTSAALAVVNHFTAPVSKANAEARHGLTPCRTRPPLRRSKQFFRRRSSAPTPRWMRPEAP